MGKVILIVEDDHFNRDLAVKILTKAGYECQTASTGLEALEMVEQSPPDLILMDLSLPEMDGWEATRRLKADEKTAKIPVIAATAHAMEGDRERALAAGCDDYFSKPYRPQDLLGMVEKYLK